VRARRRRGTASVVVFALLSLAGFVGLTFAAGYVLGKIIL